MCTVRAFGREWLAGSWNEALFIVNHGNINCNYYPLSFGSLSCVCHVIRAYQIDPFFVNTAER